MFVVVTAVGVVVFASLCMAREGKERVCVSGFCAVVCVCVCVHAPVCVCACVDQWFGSEGMRDASAVVECVRVCVWY